MHALLTFAVVTILIAGHDFVRTRNAGWRAAYLGFATLVTLRGMRTIALHAQAIVAHPPRYDFLCFWLDGRVALLHRNVYAPAFFHLLGDGLKQPADWGREFLDVGFLYPPTSIVWFAPLGLFRDPGQAVVAWQALLFATLALAAVALWRQFFRASGWAGLPVAGALLMALPATIETLDCTQTVGIALLFVLLFRGDRNAWRSGIWIALAFSIKPFLITLLIVPLIARSWRTVAACLATLAALFGAALTIVGPAAVATYLQDSPVARVPGYMYSGMWNQSLLGWILRFAHREPERLIVAHETLYLALAALIAALTIAVCTRLVRTDRDAAIGLSLMLGLLIYPQTLYFYAVLLALPIAVVWSKHSESSLSRNLIALALAAIVTLVGAPGGALTYLAIAALFSLTVCLALVSAAARRRAAARPFTLVHVGPARDPSVLAASTGSR
jgi:hypothetical protein